MVPSKWNEAVPLALPKKEGKQICPNYGGISLKDVAVKGFGVILLKRFMSEMDQRIRYHQSGLMSGRGYPD